MSKLLIVLFVAVLNGGCANYYVIPKEMTPEQAAAAVKAKEAAKAAREAAPKVIIIRTSCYPAYVCYPPPYPYAGILMPSFGASFNYTYIKRR